MLSENGYKVSDRRHLTPGSTPVQLRPRPRVYRRRRPASASTARPGKVAPGRNALWGQGGARTYVPAGEASCYPRRTAMAPASFVTRPADAPTSPPPSR